ncbi:glycosyltransferase family 4 protein [Candidatus Sumerlaeota bacterium]|nr:glycosyltransferase family 4 protein [Candidatus Sumerlaeota bacterium]
MKILQLAQSFLPTVGGMELVVHHLSNALVARGHDVTVLAAHPPETKKSKEIARAYPPRYSVRTYDFGRRFGEVLGRNRRSILRAIGSLRQEWKFDVVHAHMLYYPGYCAVLGRLQWGYPLVVTEHGMFAQVCIDRTVHAPPAVQRKTLWTVREAPVLTAPGRDAFDLLMAERPARTGEDFSRVLPNGIALPSPEKIVAIESSTIRDSMRIVMVGRNHPVKGYDVALRALGRLRSQGAEVRLTIVGEGTDRLADEARGLGLTNWVEVSPHRSGEALWRTYASAGIFWLTSRRESFGLTKFEAMSFGLPGVYNDAPGVREGVYDETNGLLFRRDDADDLAHKTKQLLNDPALRARISATARETGESHRWERLIAEYEALYNEASPRAE